MSSKSVSQIFNILFQIKNIIVFVLHGVLFSRSVQLKSSFSHEKKKTAVKSETYFSTEAIKVERGKVLKKNYIIGRNWRSAKLFIM